jgi:hypothetical protein
MQRPASPKMEAGGRTSPRRASPRSSNPLKKSASSPSPVPFMEEETIKDEQSRTYARRVREMSERFDCFVVYRKSF